MAPITRNASSNAKMKVPLTEISAHCRNVSVIVSLIVLLSQLRLGKRSEQRYGLLGGARPLGGSKKKVQRKAAGFQKKQPGKSESQKRQERRERRSSAALCITVDCCVCVLQGTYWFSKACKNEDCGCKTSADLSTKKVLTNDAYHYLAEHTFFGRNQDLEKANAFRSADALRKQKSRATGDFASVVLTCFRLLTNFVCRAVIHSWHNCVLYSKVVYDIVSFHCAFNRTMSLFWQISMHADIDVLLVADELINVPSFCSVQLLITITICTTIWLTIWLRVYRFTSASCDCSPVPQFFLSNRFTKLQIHHVFALH